VKIEKNFKKNQAIHVLDASRSVTVVERLLSDGKNEFIGEIQREYEKIRVHHKAKSLKKEYLTLKEAQANKLEIDWANHPKIEAPLFMGVKHFEDYPLREIVKYIDWTPFFQTWELHGKFPRIFEDEVVGSAAKKLYADAGEMLKEIVTNKWIKAKGVIGIWPANSNGLDTIHVFDPENPTKEIHRIECMRQQLKKAQGQPNLSLCDFIAPKSTGIRDYIGGFAVATGFGIEERLEVYKKNHDDYNAIMLKALCDRLAEAFAELMHHKVRTELWAYAKNENLSNEELIKEEYRGIRPAPGYPACPDHTEKPGLFKLLEAEKRVGIELTESFAMYPASAVSGLYFASPSSKYFGVGRIGKDQVEDLANRKGFEASTMERWLSSSINY
jgi:5-methyltetrahydrofolate--homocysteine methyltransferase